MLEKNNDFASRLKKLSFQRNCGVEKKSSLSTVKVENAKRIKIVPFLEYENMRSLLGSFDHALFEGHEEHSQLFPLVNFIQIKELLSLQFVSTSISFTTAGYIVKVADLGQNASRQKKIVFWIDSGKGHEIEVNISTRECTEAKESLLQSIVKAGNFILLQNVKLFRTFEQNVAIIAYPRGKNQVVFLVGRSLEYATCNFAGGCSNGCFKKQGLLCEKHFLEKALSLRSARSQFAYGYGAN